MCTDKERLGENGRGHHEEVSRKGEAQAVMVLRSTALKQVLTRAGNTCSADFLSWRKRLIPSRI